VEGSLIDGAYALISSSVRSIGGIIPNVTVEEVGTDTLIIDDHPVEVGAAISDHAFKAPAERMMKVGWSDSTGGFSGYSRMIYDTLLSLQTAREPFDVFTGKRYYRNMLVAQIVEATNDEMENGLMCTVVLRAINLTYTQGAEAAAANMSDPAQTASPANRGLQSLLAVPAAPGFADIFPVAA
jgi:hypothetical protein